MKLAVLGSPISHSKSPALHRAAYDQLGLDWEYSAVQTESSALEGFIASCTGDWRGLSLTMPLKRDVLALLDSRDPLVSLTGGANTVLFGQFRSRRTLRGFNTDVEGIDRALRAAGIDGLETVRMLGGGATAASAIVAAVNLGATRIELGVRSPERAAPLARLIERLGIRYSIAEISHGFHSPNPDLVISTLPGGSRIDSSLLEMSLVDAPLFDVAYDPWPSQLGRLWLDDGRTVISGIEMLIHQALLQVRVFVTGDPHASLPDEDLVFTAMRRSVGMASTEQGSVAV